VDEVIRLLGKHEALSFGALQALLSPPITEKRLRNLLSVLVKEGSVRRRLFHLCDGKASFFELTDPLRSDRGIGAVHNSLLMHNDLCAFAVETLERAFPAAICAREYEIPRSATLRKVMKYQVGTRDSLPDILLVLPGQAEGAPVFIAVEVERSIKSSKRLLKKFGKYASRTGLDGVLYLSEEERVLATLRRRYLDDVAGRARRIGHYKEHFLVTAGCPTKQVLEFKNPRNSADAPVSLHGWMQGLASVPLLQRRDQSSAHWGGACPNHPAALL
jgi:hypothetical protein